MGHLKTENKSSVKPLIFVILALLVAAGYYHYGGDLLSLEGLQGRYTSISGFQGRRPIIFLIIFCSIYIGLTTLAIPGSIFLTMLGGALLGPLYGTFVANTAGTIGALFSFYISRYFLKDFIKEKFYRQFRRMEDRTRGEGKLYLFGLRLVPVSPYVVINLVSGITGLKAWDFVWISYLGMLPGTFVASYAGRRISEIRSIGDILRPEIVIAILLIVVFYFIMKRILHNIQARHLKKSH